MASRQRLAAVVTLVALLLVACRGVSANTDPTAPPGVFAPTPSIGEPSLTTTTRPDPATTPPNVERVEISVVDPLTLEAIPGFDPIPMGDWMWGVTSKNKKWLALYFGDDSNSNSGIRLLDIGAWEVVDEWSSQPVDFVFAVADDGTVYRGDYSGPTPRLARLIVGQEEAEPVAGLSPGMSLWGPSEFTEDGRLLLVGQSLDEIGNPGDVVIAAIDGSTATVIETPLPNIRVGIVDVVEFEENQTGVVEATPALVWDSGNGRVLIVHATEDVVTEVDTRSGETQEHAFGPETDAYEGPLPTQSNHHNVVAWASTRRMAALSPDGGVLYVTGQVAEFQDDEDALRSVTTPTGLMAIDTTSWTIIDRLDAPVSEVYLSPDGSGLLAAGYSQESTGSNALTEASGLYVIDPLGLDVITHHEPDRIDQYFGPISFSEMPQVAYVTTWAGAGRVDAIDLNSGTVVASRVGDYVQMFGDVGVLGDAAGR